MIQKKPFQWLAWTGTAMLIGASILASLNLYPYFVIAFIMSNATWTAIGVLWQEKSLIVLNAVLTLIYIVGILL